ncbi:MAG TPA: hypothetical protein VII38_17090 [Polyangia bacterium]
MNKLLVCVSDSVPAPCHAGALLCDADGSHGLNMCKDSSTLMRWFASPSNYLCGWELVHCDLGCDSHGLSGANCHVADMGTTD